MPRTPSASRRAFTLIELLIVLTIIIVLAGLILAGIGVAFKQMRRTKAVATMNTIRSALTIYYNNTGGYPEGGMVEDGASNNPLLLSVLANVAPDDFKGAKYYIVGGTLVDPWAGLWRYRPAKQYPYNSTGTAIDSDNPPSPSSYQLWSQGADLKDDKGDGDEICSWK